MAGALIDWFAFATALEITRKDLSRLVGRRGPTVDCSHQIGDRVHRTHQNSGKRGSKAKCPKTATLAACVVGELASSPTTVIDDGSVRPHPNDVRLSGKARRDIRYWFPGSF